MVQVEDRAFELISSLLRMSFFNEFRIFLLLVKKIHYKVMSSLFCIFKEIKEIQSDALIIAHDLIILHNLN